MTNSTAGGPAGPLPPAAWHPDPTRRHELRYWDGTHWTEHVSDLGRTSSDPLTPALPATALGEEPPSEAATDVAVIGPGTAPYNTAPIAGSPPTAMRGIGGLASSITVLCWITVAVAGFSAFAFLNRVSVASDILDFDFDERSFSDLFDLHQRSDDADSYVGIAVLFMVLCSLAIFVLLLVWMWRVATNAQLTGRERPRLTRGWTIGGWFIPLANLVIPVLVTQDLWRASDPEIAVGDPDWRRSRGSAIVGWWWAAHLLAAVRFGIGSEADTRDEVETLRTFDTVAAGSSLAAIAAAILLMLVVRRITQRQEALFARTAMVPARPG